MSFRSTSSNRQGNQRRSAPRRTHRALTRNHAAHTQSANPTVPITTHAHAAAQTYCGREELAVKLLSLVKRVALEVRERLPQHVDLDDLAGAGVLGLLDAVQKFDARKHVKVETYARHRIRGAILDSLREMDTASRDMRKKNKAAEKTYRQLQVKLGRSVTDEEMAQALGLSLKRWYRTLQELNSVGIDWLRPNHIPEICSLDESNLPGENQETPFEACYRNEQKEIVARALTLLPERERTVISLYYQSEWTMKQIGEHLRIDESRVSQIHSAALSHLRSKVRSMLKPAAHAEVPSFVAAATQQSQAAVGY
jgi:RNA polymerase sigma factor for flagellar operon FliA